MKPLKLQEPCFWHFVFLSFNQVITVVDTQESQEIQINYLGCNDTDIELGDCDPMEYFYITYDGETTGREEIQP